VPRIVVTFLEKTKCPIIPYLKKQSQFSLVFAQKQRSGEKTKPIQSQNEPNFYPPKADLVATFRHDVYSMAKIVGEK
jgi:hypothetical protein